MELFQDKIKNRFNSLDDVRRYLAKLLNQAKSQKLNDIEIKQVRCQAYLCSLLIDAIKPDETMKKIIDIEQKLTVIEETINEQRKN